MDAVSKKSKHSMYDPQRNQIKDAREGRHTSSQGLPVNHKNKYKEAADGFDQITTALTAAGWTDDEVHDAQPVVLGMMYRDGPEGSPAIPGKLIAEKAKGTSFALPVK